jgi:hypothetical protein
MIVQTKYGLQTVPIVPIGMRGVCLIEPVSLLIYQSLLLLEVQEISTGCRLRHDSLLTIA